MNSYRQRLERWLQASRLRQAGVRFIRAQDVTAYLVGGTVRDALLGRESHDLDLAVPRGGLALARALADHVGGAYVPLDVERDVARVVAGSRRDRQHIDIAGLRAEGIIEDLWARDYTINAMAVLLSDDLGPLVDPTGGLDDLAERVLRVVRADSFEDDPLRILRGVRLRGALGFALTPDTESLARTWLPALARVSAERVRDELFRVLELADAATSLGYAASLGALGALVRGWRISDEASAQGLRTLAAFERVFGEWMIGCDVGSDPSGLPKAMASLGQYRARLGGIWSEALSADRSRWVLLKLAAFLASGEPGSDQATLVGKALHLSSRECRYLARAVAAADLSASHNQAQVPDALLIHRFFRQTGEPGLGGTAIAVVQALVSSSGAENDPSLAASVRRAMDLWRAWFEDSHGVVNPPQLLSGREVMEALGLQPGPAIGAALIALREAQVLGLVDTRKDAIRYLRQREKA